jgi:hypothetical protein
MNLDDRITVLRACLRTIVYHQLEIKRMFEGDRKVTESGSLPPPISDVIYVTIWKEVIEDILAEDFNVKPHS